MTIPLGSKFYVREGAGYTWRGVGEERYELPSDARPVVVIDPEDREAVEGLLNAYYGHPVDTYLGTLVDQLQAALREYANPKPPKPEEPTGLGAVVEDAAGTRWVRVFAHPDHPGLWRQTASAIERSWRDVDAAKVLSPGVTS